MLNCITMYSITAFNCTFSQTVNPRLHCDIWWVEDSILCLICAVNFQSRQQSQFSFSLDIMKKPVTLGCGHSGCENCLSTLASIRAPNCPHCRVPYRSDQLSLNVAMDNVITTLEVRCTNQGCEWKGAYSEAERHYKECPKMEKKCPNEGCSQMVARETIAAHLNSCAKQKIPCQDCRLLVARDRLDRHRASMCGLSVAQCPLCGTQLTR